MSAVERPSQRLELIATILLAAATVATAWSGYQASRWNGEQAKAFSRGSALRVESAKADSLANTQTEIDVATFTQWVDALAHDETELAEFYARRFRPEFKPAVKAWQATKPLHEPERAADALPDAAVRAGRERGSGAARSAGRGAVREGPGERAARDELRARRRPLRRRPLLRRHLDETAVASPAPGTAHVRRRSSSSRRLRWIATFPISLSV